MASYASTPLPEGLALRDPKTGDFVHYSYADLIAEFARPLDYSLLEEDIKPTIIGKKIVELRDPRTGDMREYSFIELHYELQCRYQIEMKQQGRWKSDEEVTEEAENSYYSPEASALMDADMENYSILTDPEAECVRRVANFWTAISMVPYMRAQRAAEERVAREGGHFKDYIAIERERQGSSFSATRMSHFCMPELWGPRTSNNLLRRDACLVGETFHRVPLSSVAFPRIRGDIALVPSAPFDAARALDFIIAFPPLLLQARMNALGYLLRLLDEDGGVPAHLNEAALKALEEAPVPDAPGTGGDEDLEKKWRETHPLLPNLKTGVWEEYRLKDVLDEFGRAVDYALLGPGYRWPSQGIYRGRISLYLRDPRTQKIRPYTDAEIGDEFRRRRLIEAEVQRRTPKKVDLRAFLESTYQKIHANDHVDSGEESGSEASAESYDSHPEKSWTTKELLNVVRTEVLEELDRFYHGDGSYSDPAFEDIDIPTVLDVIEDAAKRRTKKKSK